MVSIIICSVNPRMLSDLVGNIDKTIGTPYEIIPFDNRTASLGICEVYNQCANEAKFPNLLFLHEDVKFYSQNWGLILTNLLDNPEIGLIGMAGAVFKSSAPTSWVSVPKEYYRNNQYFSKEDCLQAVENTVEGYDEVVVVDGMFLSMTKRNWQYFRFDNLLYGFHMYDMDLCYRVHKEGLLIVVPRNIVIQHFSRGKFSAEWAKASLNWHKNKELPLSNSAISNQDKKFLESESRAQFFAYLISNGFYPKSWIWNWISICTKNRKVHLGILLQILRKYKQIITHNF